MRTIHRAGLMAVALPLAFAGASVSPAASAAINGDVVVFLGSAPLWNGTAFDVKDRKLTIRFDNKVACVEQEFDTDNGWLCKGDNNAVKPGKHKVAVSFTDLAGKSHTLHATLTLKAEDKKLEMPDKPDQGEKFWCVSITTTKIELMPKSDARCQTD